MLCTSRPSTDAQECDRLDDVKGATPDHAAVEAKGPGKLHGLVVLYRQARFRQLTTRTVMLDDEELTPEAETPVARRGISRQTRNIGLIVALQETAEEREKKGLIVVTTHL
jgi:RNA exonuclease NGL2